MSYLAFFDMARPFFFFFFFATRLTRVVYTTGNTCVSRLDPEVPPIVVLHSDTIESIGVDFVCLLACRLGERRQHFPLKKVVGCSMNVHRGIIGVLSMASCPFVMTRQHKGSDHTGGFLLRRTDIKL